MSHEYFLWFPRLNHASFLHLNGVFLEHTVQYWMKELQSSQRHSIDGVGLHISSTSQFIREPNFVLRETCVATFLGRSVEGALVPRSLIIMSDDMMMKCPIPVPTSGQTMLCCPRGYFSSVRTRTALRFVSLGWFNAESRPWF